MKSGTFSFQIHFLLPILIGFLPLIATGVLANGDAQSSEKPLLNEFYFTSHQVYEMTRVPMPSSSDATEKHFVKVMRPVSPGDLSLIPDRLFGQSRRIRLVYREIPLPQKTDGKTKFDYQPISTVWDGPLGDYVNVNGDPVYLEHYLDFRLWEILRLGANPKDIFDLMNIRTDAATKVLDSRTIGIYRYIPTVLTMALERRKTALYDQIISYPSLTKFSELEMTHGEYVQYMLHLIHFHPNIMVDANLDHVPPAYWKEILAISLVYKQHDVFRIVFEQEVPFKFRAKEFRTLEAMIMIHGDLMNNMEPLNALLHSPRIMKRFTVLFWESLMMSYMMNTKFFAGIKAIMEVPHIVDHLALGRRGFFESVVYTTFIQSVKDSSLLPLFSWPHVTKHISGELWLRMLKITNPGIHRKEAIKSLLQNPVVADRLSDDGLILDYVHFMLNQVYVDSELVGLLAQPHFSSKISGKEWGQEIIRLLNAERHNSWSIVPLLKSQDVMKKLSPSDFRSIMGQMVVYRLDDRVIAAFAEPHIMTRVEIELGSKYWETLIELFLSKHNTLSVAALLKSEVIAATIPVSHLEPVIKDLLSSALEFPYIAEVLTLSHLTDYITEKDWTSLIDACFQLPSRYDTAFLILKNVGSRLSPSALRSYRHLILKNPDRFLWHGPQLVEALQSEVSDRLSKFFKPKSGPYGVSSSGRKQLPPVSRLQNSHVRRPVAPVARPISYPGLGARLRMLPAHF